MTYNVIRALSEATPRNVTTTAAQTAVGAVAGQVLAANNDRKGLIIQNTGTTTIYLVLGTGTPTATVYHLALSAAGAADNGTGGSYVDDAWLGAVQAIGSGAGGTIVITEIT